MSKMSETGCGVCEFLFYPTKYLQILGIVKCNRQTFAPSKIQKMYTLFVILYLIIQFTLNMCRLVIIRQPFSKIIFLATITDFILYGTITTAALISILVSYFYYKKKMQMFVLFSSVEKQLDQIGVKINFNVNSWRLKILVYISIMLFIFTTDLIVFFITNIPGWGSLMWLRYSTRFISWSHIYYFVSVLNVIRIHFKEINRQFTLLLEIFLQYNAIPKVDTNVMKKIKTLVCVHSALRKLYRFQNVFYGLQISVILVSFLSKIVSYTYFAVLKIISSILQNSNQKQQSILLDLYFITYILGFYITFYLILKIIVNTNEEVRNVYKIIKPLTR